MRQQINKKQYAKNHVLIERAESENNKARNQKQLVCLRGGISKEGEYLLQPLREYVYAGDYNKFMPKTEIKAASLFNDAGIIGAALASDE